MQTTFQKAFDFLDAASGYKRKQKGKDSKFSYAVDRAIAKVKKVREDFMERVNDIEIDECLTEEGTGKILRGDKQELCFNKEGQRNRNKRVKKLLTEKCNVETHTCIDVPEDLTPEELESFAGFVIEIKATTKKKE